MDVDQSKRTGRLERAASYTARAFGPHEYAPHAPTFAFVGNASLNRDDEILRSIATVKCCFNLRALLQTFAPRKQARETGAVWPDRRAESCDRLLHDSPRIAEGGIDHCLRFGVRETAAAGRFDRRAP